MIIKNPFLHLKSGRVHVGTAMSLAGLAILLSGSLVFAAVPANDTSSYANDIRELRAQFARLTENVDAIRQQCNIQPKAGAPAQPQPGTAPSASLNGIPANCISKCKEVSSGSITSYQRCVEIICTVQPTPAPNAPTTIINPNQPNFDMASCLNACEETARACSVNAGKNATALQTCTTTYNACTATCKTRQQAAQR